MKTTTVADAIALLSTFPKDIPVSVHVQVKWAFRPSTTTDNTPVDKFKRGELMDTVRSIKVGATIAIRSTSDNISTTARRIGYKVTCRQMENGVHVTRLS